MKKLLFLIGLFMLPAGAMTQHVEQADSVAKKVELDDIKTIKTTSEPQYYRDWDNSRVNQQVQF